MMFSEAVLEMRKKHNPHNDGSGFIFNSLSDLTEFVNQYNMHDCWFRGQSRLWPLTSSLHRHQGTDLWERAGSIFTSVGSWLINNPLISTAIKTENCAVAVAQHFGCPTDLIDITDSFQTAAYFASSCDGEGDGCIWVFTMMDFSFVEECIKLLKADNVSTDKIVDDDWQMFVKVNIPELSRLNAKSGAFLWDFGGIMPSIQKTIGFGTRLVFKHQSNERDERFETVEKKLFPLPNSLETEIMRVLSEKQRVKSLECF